MGLWMPAYYGDGMVLQRDERICVYGTDEPYQRIRVELAGETVLTEAKADGRWETVLEPKSAAMNLVMTVEGSDRSCFQDVCIGDVFLISGQSNMELPVRRVKEQYEEELEQDFYPQIRQFAVPQIPDYKGIDQPVTDGRWISAVGEEKEEFSALGYFFAAEIWKHHQVPVGLLFAAVGGTTIQAWLGEEVLLKISPEYKNGLNELKSDEYRAAVEKENEKNASVWEMHIQENDTVVEELKQGIPSEWMTFDIPGKLSGSEELQNFCGSIWFRKEVILKKEQIRKKAVLSLGTMVDADITYVNGKKVGETGYQYPPRRYPIPDGLLKEGENEILFCLKVQNGQGEFVPDKPYQLVLKDENGTKTEVSLIGRWQCRIGCRTAPAAVQRRMIRESCGLYNGMIYPLRKLKFRAVLWYQGESNTEKDDRPECYEMYLKALVEAWRKQFNNDKLPFIIIQLANYMEAEEFQENSSWAMVREAQRKAASETGAGLVTAIDLGEYNDLHPVRKKELAARAAWCAEDVVYGVQNREKLSPVPEKCHFDGKNIVVKFANAEGGLYCSGDEAEVYVGFCKSGYKKCRVKLRGNRMLIEYEGVIKNTKIRYAWADNPSGATVYNREGLPVVPFEAKLTADSECG